MAVADKRSRSRSPLRSGILEACQRKLKELCELHCIPPSHGSAHAERVLGHAQKALAAAQPTLPNLRQLAVQLAALLHDVDDRKYFPACPKGQYPNAKRIMEEACADTTVVLEALEMISLVSCSANGNSVPVQAQSAPEFLWPRWADRLEATGEVGAVRCWQYNQEKGSPLSTPSTPRPSSELEVWQLATPERFEKYQTSGGQSASMMDHYYDKLLRVARPPSEALQNAYFEAEMSQRSAPLVEICLAFGKTGEVPVDKLRAMEKTLQLEDA